MMNFWKSVFRFATTAVVLFGVALPVAAQQAPAPAAAPPPAAQPPAAQPPTAQPTAERPRIRARDLMTAVERAEFRATMRKARSAAERREIWARKRVELRQRAAERGFVLFERPMKRSGQNRSENRPAEGAIHPPRAP